MTQIGVVRVQLRRFVASAAAPLIAAGLALGSAGVAAASPTLATQANVVSRAPTPGGQPGTWQPDDHLQCRNHHMWMRWKRYNSTTHRWEYRYRDTGRRC